MRMRFLLVVAVLLLINSTNFADVGPTKLETVIHEADLIVVGKVVGVKVFDSGFKLAEVKITKVLRGETRSVRLYYIASPLTREDVSNAREGETALLFLRRLRKPPSQYPSNVRAVTNGDAIFLVAAAGRGRLIPVTIDGDDYIQFWRDRGILLSPMLSALWRQDPVDPSSGFVRLSDLMNFIKQ